jgi:hypothetical protein
VNIEQIIKPINEIPTTTAPDIHIAVEVLTPLSYTPKNIRIIPSINNTANKPTSLPYVPLNGDEPLSLFFIQKAITIFYFKVVRI